MDWTEQLKKTSWSLGPSPTEKNQQCIGVWIDQDHDTILKFIISEKMRQRGKKVKEKGIANIESRKELETVTVISQLIQLRFRCI